MLSELRLSAFGVVEDAVLELGPGLNALTGETGAGKTMIVSGLGHLLGARADSGVVRRGAERATVQGRWEVDPDIVARVHELGGDTDGAEVVTLRQVSAQGRSRAVVGGAATPVSTMATLLGELATIHGQSEQIRLSLPERQRELLDAHAKPSQLPGYRDAYRQRKAAAEELMRLEEEAEARTRESDMLRYGLGEIDEVEPQPGEDEQLAAEQRRLMDLDELRALTGRAGALLSGPEDDLDVPGAVSLIGQARKTLVQLARLDVGAEPLATRAEELQVLADDVAAEVASYAADLVADPLRLEAVGQRRAELATLTRKYGRTVEDVLDWADNARRRLAELEGSDERIDELRARIERLDGQLAADAAAITEARQVAAEEARGSRRRRAEGAGDAPCPVEIRCDSDRARTPWCRPDRIVVLRQPRLRACTVGQSRLGWRALTGAPGAGSGARRRRRPPHLCLRRGGCRRGRGRGAGNRAPASSAGGTGAGDRGDPPGSGRGLRRPAFRHR
ncbi:MAG: AAA family ATPase [Tessaracoccus sp.]